MPKLIYTARFLDGREFSSKNAAYLSDSIDYNATREGTELISLEKTLQYNAQRPGVDVINDGDVDHGLFSINGKCNLEREKQDVVNAYQNGSIIWKAIISLHEDDATDKGLDSWENWKDLVSSHVPKIAETYGISLGNFKWNAGYHTNTDNPHIHLTFYSTNSDEGRLSKNDTIKSFRQIKSSIVNDLFSEEVEQLKLDKNKLRDTLKNDINKKEYLNYFQNKELKDLVLTTLEELPRNGRKYYGYMPENIKENINSILKEIIQSDDDLKQQFDNYKANHQNFVEIYNVEDENINYKMNEFEERFFNPSQNDLKVFHNVILENLYKLRDYNEIEEMFNKSINPKINYNSDKKIQYNHQYKDLKLINLKYFSNEEIIDNEFKLFNFKNTNQNSFNEKNYSEYDKILSNISSFNFNSTYNMDYLNNNYGIFCVNSATSLVRLFNNDSKDNSHQKNSDVIFKDKKKRNAMTL
ncbi:MAG: MobP3 family relaxase [Bacilli bacterium]